jgi:hypothetical protein
MMAVVVALATWRINWQSGNRGVVAFAKTQCSAETLLDVSIGSFLGNFTRTIALPRPSIPATQVTALGNHSKSASNSKASTRRFLWPKKPQHRNRYNPRISRSAIALRATPGNGIPIPYPAIHFSIL